MLLALSLSLSLSLSIYIYIYIYIYFGAAYNLLFILLLSFFMDLCLLSNFPRYIIFTPMIGYLSFLLFSKS